MRVALRVVVELPVGADAPAESIPDDAERLADAAAAAVAGWAEVVGHGWRIERPGLAVAQ